MCPERSHSALFPEFDLTISCPLSRSLRGSAWPRPTLHGLAGWGRGPWGFAPPAGVPPSHSTCHTSEGIGGAPAPSAWRGRQPGWAWVGRASPPVFLPDVQCRGAHSAQCSPSLRLSPGPPWAEAGPRSPALGPALGPLCSRVDPLAGCVLVYRVGDASRHNPGTVLTESAQRGSLLGGRAG